jgi:hypothetical protein
MASSWAAIGPGMSRVRAARAALRAVRALMSSARNLARDGVAAAGQPGIGQQAELGLRFSVVKASAPTAVRVDPLRDPPELNSLSVVRICQVSSRGVGVKRSEKRGVLTGPCCTT